ncbi:hypothetical protein DdX_16483 [Ditylenchus destructor]|uniref:Uncharacterized protein n=1 Tax=Ditylenchus destructor TaxID=166010 RepID=A0AAD4QZW5_9BILA|nr:hypothetical protein DdX_16483 [Ditylenchus destructor]
MSGIKLIALVSVFCVLYSANFVETDDKDQRKIKDVGIGPTISNLLPPGEIKDKFDKLEMQDMKDAMEFFGQALKFENLDHLLGKLYEKNPEAANFIRLVLDKMGCDKEDQKQNCMPKMKKIKDALKSLLDPLSAFKDQIMAALMGMIMMMQNAILASSIMQMLSS